MINNLEQISNLLNFQSEDDFYFLQVIKRRKENPDLHKNNPTILYIPSND